MALQASLRPIAQGIAEAVREYAESQGVSKDDYALVGSFNGKSDRISLILGIEGTVDKRQWYSDLLASIRRKFPGDPLLTMHLGLVIEQVRNLTEIYQYFGVDEDEIDLTGFLDRP